MLDLIVIGHILKEKIVFPDGRELGPLLGSPAAYGAAAAARLGLSTGLVTKCGPDMPEELTGLLRKAGVDLRGLKRGAKTTANELIYDGKGQKRLEFLSKAEDILPADIPPEYFAAPCFLVAPIDYEAGEELLRHLGESGKMVSAEISGFGGASSAKQRGDSPEEKAKYLRKITPHFRIVKAGAEDCKCLFGPGNDEKAMAEKFLDWGAQIAVITRGERGVLIASRSAPGRPAEIIELPAFRTQAVDCTGAGDVWHAGFLYEYLKNNRLEQAGRFANALSSIVIEKSGGVTPDRFPDAKEVYERMRT